VSPTEDYFQAFQARDAEPRTWTLAAARWKFVWGGRAPGRGWKRGWGWHATHSGVQIGVQGLLHKGAHHLVVVRRIPAAIAGVCGRRRWRPVIPPVSPAAIRRQRDAVLRPGLMDTCSKNLALRQNPAARCCRRAAARARRLATALAAGQSAESGRGCEATHPTGRRMLPGRVWQPARAAASAD